MTQKKGRNIAGSHRAKLLNLSRDRREDFQFLLGRWVSERFLFRLSHSPHRNDFVLKGAMLFVAWEGRLHRPTKDLDLLGYRSSDVEKVTDRIRDICSVVADDGIVFDVRKIMGERIKEDAEYEGVRVRVPASLDGARVSMQVDVGFGELIDPPASELDFPVLLPLDAPRVRAYSPEAVVAEKFHAMVVLGIANSRMKDFFDIWTLASTRRFEMTTLTSSIRGTFERRRTAVPDSTPLALTSEFLLDEMKRKQWDAFCNRLGLKGIPGLAEIGRLVAGFLMPAIAGSARPAQPRSVWDPPGPWKEEQTSIKQQIL